MGQTYKLHPDGAGLRVHGIEMGSYGLATNGERSKLHGLMRLLNGYSKSPNLREALDT